MRYVMPDLEGNTIAYKGRRFWVIELAPNRSFQCVDTTMADFVVFDRLDNAPIGRVIRLIEGGFEVRTVMGFEGPDSAATLKEAAQVADALVKQEMRSIS